MMKPVWAQRPGLTAGMMLMPPLFIDSVEIRAGGIGSAVTGLIPWEDVPPVVGKRGFASSFGRNGVVSRFSR